MGRTSRHPAKVRRRGAPGRIVQAPAQTSGAWSSATSSWIGAASRPSASSRPSRLSPEARERVEVVPGSHGDTDVVNKAFVGADSVFWLVPPDPHAESVEAAYVDFSRPAAETIIRHGVKRVVTVSLAQLQQPPVMLAEKPNLPKWMAVWHDDFIPIPLEIVPVHRREHIAHE